jgi:YbbR domain-containing protein
MKAKWSSVVVENFSYKMVSLFIALILWLTILGRRDFSLTKTIDVELIPAAGAIVSMQSVDSVKLKVSGPRAALKKFMESGMSQLVSIDVSKKGEGNIEVEVPLRQIDLPFGVKVMSVKPTVIRAQINRKSD